MVGHKGSLRRAAVLGVAVAALVGLGRPASAAAQGSTDRYVVTVNDTADFAGAKATLQSSGFEIVAEYPEIAMLVVRLGAAAPAALATAAGIGGMVPDRITRISPPEGEVPRTDAPGLRSARLVPMAGTGEAPSTIKPDPAFGYKGLLWDYRRLGLPAAWGTSAGRAAVTVGVADTGVDFTHVDLKSSVVHVEDFTADDRPSACKAFLGPSAPSDKDLARKFGGPAATDWNGHGSWIGGNIAAALNGTGTNGIAPKVGLVALKIAENCGYAYDSDIIGSFVWAAKHGLDIVSISFGGYLDRTDPAQEAIYKAYAKAVAFARSRGTLIVAAAGNEHLRLGSGGKVLSHGPLTTPGDPFDDYYGLYEVPGGLPGVVNVASTGNRTIPSSASCAVGTTGNPKDLGATATCKPRNDRHQAAGQGVPDQLAYYSNFGPRIDVAAPGGARKFNLPYWDRGGTPGFPYVVADATNAWEEFSTNSNWATEIPCFTFEKGSGFTPGQCYSTIQGTSMATPHVSAVLALIASAKPALRGKPDRLVAFLKSRTRPAHNLTEGLSATDRSKGDLMGPSCESGYCHLGGPSISDADAYGAGIVQAVF